MQQIHVYKKCNMVINHHLLLVLFIEFWLKDYIESWGQTFGTPDFDLQVWSVQASRSEVPGVEQKQNHKSNRSIWSRYQRILR